MLCYTEKVVHSQMNNYTMIIRPIVPRFLPGNEKYALSLKLTRLICLHLAMVHLLK